ncbi:MAG: nucleoside-diphosphate kinase [Euryarchaeota archaeon]|nr:nucleoside-diphosphate kinase [Euryarchaeota archaeon]
MEKTFFMIKPDGVQRGLVGQIIRRVEDKGLKIVAMKMRRLDQATAEEHYAEHREKPFFKDLVDFIISGPSVPMVVEGKDVISEIRRINGATNPTEALPGTIRGDFGLDTGRNVVHGSDSPASAEREMALHFDALEIIDYSRIDEAWLYE